MMSDNVFTSRYKVQRIVRQGNHYTVAYDIGSVKMFLYVLNVANTGLIFVNSRFWMQGVTLLLHKLEP